MTGIGSIAATLGKIFGLIIAGYALFQIKLLARRTDLFLKIILNVFFPIYFIHNLSTGWDGAMSAGWYWMAVFFFSCCLMIGAQYLIAKLLIKKVSLFQTPFSRELMILTAVHNAGYIPLPVIQAIAPQVISIYLFFYCGDLALYGVLVLLGAILATIPLSEIRFNGLFAWFVVFRMVLYPALFLAAFIFVSFRSLSAEMGRAMKTAFVLEAAVPPATNILIAARAFGRREQEVFIGNGIIHTYAASIITLPVFLLLSNLIY
jgi:predicted permease